MIAGVVPKYSDEACGSFQVAISPFALAFIGFPLADAIQIT
jgi:hypothetical protein